MLLQRLFTDVNTGGREQIVGSNSRHARYRDVIQWLSSEEEAQWDAFVMRHPLGVVYQLSAWKHVLEDAFYLVVAEVVVAQSLARA